MTDAGAGGHIESLDAAECYERLRSRTLGRVAIAHADEIVILPVYYAVVGDDVVFRTAPGTKLDAAMLEQRVAFEIDGASPGWSVLVQGHAEEIRDAGQQVGARSHLGNDWPAGERDVLVRIRAERVSGRRLPPAS